MAISALRTEMSFRRVLVATDFSAASEKALQYAAALAGHYKAKLYVAHVVSSAAVTLGADEADYAVEQVASQDICRLETALHGLDHQMILAHGGICEALQDIVREKD